MSVEKGQCVFDECLLTENLAAGPTMNEVSKSKVVDAA